MIIKVKKRVLFLEKRKRNQKHKFYFKKNNIMPPKVSAKSKEKAKQKVIEDKTFGLKNKNRSAKVQAYCAQVQQTVRYSNRDDVKAELEREQKRQAKKDKKAFEEAMSKLYADGDKRKDGGSESDEEDEESPEEQLGVNPEEYLWRPEDFDEVEFDAGRLEEILENEREKLKDRTDLTPVTEETFRAWREKVKAEKAAREKKRVEAAKAGKGKLKGWDLWNEKKELFVDDEDGEEAYIKEFDDAALFEGEDEENEDQMDFGDDDKE